MWAYYILFTNIVARYTFGGKLYDGIVLLITQVEILPRLRLDENPHLFAYEFPQNRPVFMTPAYDSEEQLISRVPDFRHTLYWNPDITLTTDAVLCIGYERNLCGDFAGNHG